MENKDKVKEWSVKKKWNPFNSFKLLSQVYRWKLIERGKGVPQPALVTVDPSNNCNLNCSWCNSEPIIRRSNRMLSKNALLKIADFLAEWEGSDKWGKGVEAVCLAGGGEPLLNPHTGDFINRCVENGIGVGIVTNGTEMDKFIEPLSKCTWVGISVDGGSAETIKNIKGVDVFDKVIQNIRKLSDYSKENKTKLASPGQGYGISYKYLLYPLNISEIYESTKLAKEIGCKNFHMRPVGVPWDKLKKGENDFLDFNEENIKKFKEQVAKARELEDENFGVFGITHKFDDKFEISNRFSNCYAIFMTAVFMPPSIDNPDAFNLGLCCDRRGDSNLILGENITDTGEASKLWGSGKHWEVFDKIKVGCCPRCTYQPHNQIYEHVILEDNMTYKFI
ncbi:radical SAM protein [Nanoarchaeota archaeon]